MKPPTVLDALDLLNRVTSLNRTIHYIARPANGARNRWEKQRDALIDKYNALPDDIQQATRVAIKLNPDLWPITDSNRASGPYAEP